MTLHDLRKALNDFKELPDETMVLLKAETDELYCFVSELDSKIYTESSPVTDSNVIILTEGQVLDSVRK